MSAVSDDVLTRSAKPASSPGRPARSAGARLASACSGSSQIHALTDLRSSRGRGRRGQGLGGQVAGGELRDGLRAVSWFGAVIGGPQLALDPQPGHEQSGIRVALADELDADGNPSDRCRAGKVRHSM